MICQGFLHPDTQQFEIIEHAASCCENYNFHRSNFEKTIRKIELFLSNSDVLSKQFGIMSEQNSGYVYYQPQKDGNGYVGQSVQERGERERQHASKGKDNVMTYDLNCDLPKSSLDEKEAYHIGQKDSYENGANRNRGNLNAVHDGYQRGQTDSMKACNDRLEKTADNVDRGLQRTADTIDSIPD